MKERKTKWVHVRLSPQEKNDIEIKALNAGGLDISKYIRQMLGLN